MLQRDKNRAELVRAIIRQNGGRIFTVIAKRKTPKHYFVIEELCNEVCKDVPHELGEKIYLNTKKSKILLEDLKTCKRCKVTEHIEHFMTMTCRTGVKKQLASNTIIEYKNQSGAIMSVEHFDSLSEENQDIALCIYGWKPVYKETKSTIAHDENLVSVNLTNGKGYRCFSAFNVLELRAGGTVIKFKEEDVLAFEG